eukprot:3939188-Rhodomonas_salina.1
MIVDSGPDIDRIASSEVADLVRAEIDDFKPLMPIITALRNPVPVPPSPRLSAVYLCNSKHINCLVAYLSILLDEHPEVAYRRFRSVLRYLLLAFPLSTYARYPVLKAECMRRPVLTSGMELPGLRDRHWKHMSEEVCSYALRVSKLSRVCVCARARACHKTNREAKWNRRWHRN